MGPGFGGPPPSRLAAGKLDITGLSGGQPPVGPGSGGPSLGASAALAINNFPELKSSIAPGPGGVSPEALMAAPFAMAGGQPPIGPLGGPFLGGLSPEALAAAHFDATHAAAGQD